MAELFDVQRRPAAPRDDGQHHQRQRRRPPPAAQPHQPGAGAARRRRAPAGHAGVPGGAAGGPSAADGRCEFVDAFAKPYPSLTIAHVLGAPLEDAPRLHHWSNWIQRQFDAASLMNERERIEQACVEAYAYLDELLAARRESPGEDVDLRAAGGRGRRGTAVGPGGRRPRARPHPGRHRHRPEPALPRGAPARRTSRPMGALRERPDELAGPPSRRRCATSR